MNRDFEIGEERAGPGPGSGLLALLVGGGAAPAPIAQEPFIEAGLQVETADGLAEAVAKCKALSPPLLFVPLSVDPALLDDLLRPCLSREPGPVVVVIATNNEIDVAAEAMRAGAFECLFRPFSPARLAKIIDQAVAALPAAARRVESHRVERIAAPPPAAVPDTPGPIVRVIAASGEMRALVDRANTLAASRAPVFITGDVGTGKTLFAESIHAASDVAPDRLRSINGPTLAGAGFNAEAPDIEGAATLVIEEVCELDPAVQAQLLSAIDAWEHQDAGPRLIATTRHDPAAAIRDGRLRPALFYRLNVATLALPPLAGRGDDIIRIARTKLGEYVRAERTTVTGFSDAALDLLALHDWPGNVRELLNLLWQLAVTHNAPLITPAGLPDEITSPPRQNPGPARPGPGGDATGLIGRPLAEIEREVIEATIRAEGGSLPRAARVLEVSPSTLYRKRAAWGAGDDD